MPKTEADIRYVDQKTVFEQLFDLNNDPMEVKNLMLYEERKSIKKMMRQKWKNWQQQVRE